MVRVIGFVPPLERLAMRQISARFLSQDQRIEIADLRQAGLGVLQIAAELGRAPSTISRELRRNATSAGRYRPFEAHRRAGPPSPAAPGDERSTSMSLIPK
jgi:transposase, IS30 family